MLCSSIPYLGILPTSYFLAVYALAGYALLATPYKLLHTRYSLVAIP